MKNFALVGAAGYVAPRHMAAICETGNNLVAAYDPKDSVGIIDSYFPDSHFFTEFERFDRHIDKMRREKPEQAIHFVSICSPNYLHDSHIRFALRSGANVVCEKPLVVNPWNLDAIAQIEKETKRKVNSILQLRLHPAIIALRETVLSENRNGKYEVDLTYVTARGRWYGQSWKGVEQKSGGIIANIGVHFFDMLHFLFGDVQESSVHLRGDARAAGYLEFKHARVRWFLSIKLEDVPPSVRETGQRTFRSIQIDGQEFEFSGGFTDLHQRSYEEILAGRGFGIEDNRVAINTVADMRRCGLTSAGEMHPFVAGLV